MFRRSKSKLISESWDLFSLFSSVKHLSLPLLLLFGYTHQWPAQTRTFHKHVIFFLCFNVVQKMKNSKYLPHYNLSQLTLNSLWAHMLFCMLRFRFVYLFDMDITVTLMLQHTIIPKYVSVDSKMLIYITCYVLCELSLLPQWLVMVFSHQLSLYDVGFFCLFFFVYSKRCMKSSWRAAACTWNTPLVSPYSLSLRIRRVEQPQLWALRETAVLYSEAPLWLFLRLVPQTQAIWNIPKPYLSFFADCFYLDCCGLRIISDCLKRAWHH